MQYSDFILLSVFGGGLLVLANVGSMLSSNWGHLRRYPLVLLVCLAAYLLWERQGVIDDTCLALQQSMDWVGDGPKHATKTRSYEATLLLFDQYPSMRKAKDVCFASTYY